MRNKANLVVLEGFLSELLVETIRVERILDSETNRTANRQESDDDKFNLPHLLKKAPFVLLVFTFFCELLAALAFEALMNRLAESR